MTQIEDDWQFMKMINQTGEDWRFTKTRSEDDILMIHEGKVKRDWGDDGEHERRGWLEEDWNWEMTNP